MDKTTARMTKDLYGYNDYFADELDALIGKRTTELAPLYRRLQKTAVDRLEELNKELETIPEAKRKSKRVQIKMQEQYVAQILPDLELALAAQDPYVTEVLHGTFEYGYYTQAYSLEQATQVAVNVPILNRAGVLGLIANDWVGDGHTYSDRIRASTALVATNAEKTIKNLVTKRLSYNEAANELKDAIGESYNNAIRIVRTEMTRANGLGASYAAMENADILDGKYRDAVRDKRTSGMCAADADYSIKKPYPLDYDTPANPGVPGKRIPNHPNCRCNWRMVLSAIGIRNRSQLARKNDSKESYGERYYTEAKTYDAYAKERGLPSVKEMLEKDNPKRYLRPGETLESLNKKVKRVKVNGKTVTVSKAAWDKDGAYGIKVADTTNTVKAVDNLVENAKIVEVVTDTPVTATLAELIQDKTTVQELNDVATAYFTNKPGCNITSVSFASTDVDAVKSMLTKLDDLDDRFKSSASSIRATGRMSDGIGGQCVPTNASFMDYCTSSDPSVLRSEITLNSKFLKSKKVIQDDFNAQHRSRFGGVAHAAMVDEQYADIVTLVHEYGHSILPGKANEILLGNGGTNDVYLTARRLYRQYTKELTDLNREIQRLRDSFAGQPDGLRKGIEAAKDLQAQYDAMCISKYSKESVGEFIAEAFCDAELSSNPKPYSVKVHNLLVKAFGKEVKK